MKLRFLILCALITLLAAACVTPASPVATNPPAQKPAPTGSSAYPPAAYPSPAAAAAYPAAPISQAPAAKPGVLYPDLGDGAQVSWQQALSMIMNNEVSKAVQTHELKVFLTLKDGRTLATVEPQIDDILNFLKDCGAPCKDIPVATE